MFMFICVLLCSHEIHDIIFLQNKHQHVQDCRDCIIIVIRYLRLYEKILMQAILV